MRDGVGTQSRGFVERTRASSAHSPHLPLSLSPCVCIYFSFRSWLAGLPRLLCVADKYALLPRKECVCGGLGTRTRLVVLPAQAACCRCQRFLSFCHPAGQPFFCFFYPLKPLLVSRALAVLVLKCSLERCNRSWHAFLVPCSRRRQTGVRGRLYGGRQRVPNRERQTRLSRAAADRLQVINQNFNSSCSTPAVVL